MSPRLSVFVSAPVGLISVCFGHLGSVFVASVCLFDMPAPLYNPESVDLNSIKHKTQTVFRYNPYI